MDINEAIVKYGTEAVLRYRTVAALVQDNELPEVFLGGFIGHSDYGYHWQPLHAESA
jgi:hypothetical protein